MTLQGKDLALPGWSSDLAESLGSLSLRSPSPEGGPITVPHAWIAVLMKKDSQCLLPSPRAHVLWPPYPHICVVYADVHNPFHHLPRIPAAYLKSHSFPRAAALLSWGLQSAPVHPPFLPTWAPSLLSHSNSSQHQLLREGACWATAAQI